MPSKNSLILSSVSGANKTIVVLIVLLLIVLGFSFWQGMQIVELKQQYYNLPAGSSLKAIFSSPAGATPATKSSGSQGNDTNMIGGC